MNQSDSPRLDPLWVQQVRNRLLDWFRHHRRTMPWRENPTPYYVWLAEVMLQQTQVATVIPYFERFVARFPTIEALASAPIEEVLRYWEGLGYYARAHHLHETAKRVVQAGGELPKQVDKLRELPGIGAYTAGAIASIAFQQPEPVVDGNVTRVLARLLWLKGNLQRGKAHRALWQIARQMVDPHHPGDFNQALMELGSTVCTPLKPACEQCPLQSLCSAFARGAPTAVPEAVAAKPTQKAVDVSVVVLHAGSILLAKRPEQGLWAGLWEFPRATWRGREELETVAQQALDSVGVQAELGQVLGRVRHAVTYLRIELYGYLCRFVAGTPRSTYYVQIEWVPLDQLTEYALPAPQRRLTGLLRDYLTNHQLDLYSTT